MARKYRGKYDGKTRGEYVRKAFISLQQSEEENRTYFNEINRFLRPKGYLIEDSESSCRSFNSRRKVYHIGGATIGVRKMDFKDGLMILDTRKNKNFIRIKMVSNQGLDDIVEMIKNKCSSFREIGFDTMA